MGSKAFGALTRSYARAHFGKSLLWCLGELVFAYFLTEVAGLSGWAMAMVMSAGMTANAGIDMLIGQHLARRPITLAEAGQAQMTGVSASAAALLMLFFTSFVPAPLRTGYALLTMLVFRASYALYDVPQNTMLSLGTADAAGRQRVSALRLLLSGAASLTVAAATAAILALTGEDSRRSTFCACAAAFALIAIATAYDLARATQVFRRRSSMPVRAGALPGILGPSLSLAVLLLIMFLFSLGVAIYTTLEPYYVSAVMHRGSMAGLLMIALSLGVMAGQPLWLKRARSAAPCALRVPLLLLLVALAVFALCAPLGVYAQLGSALLLGIAQGGVGQMIWAAYSDSVSARAPGREALAFGVLTGVGKMGLVVSTVVVGGAVTINHHAHDKVSSLLMAMIPIPMLCIAIMLGVLTLAMTRTNRLATPSRLKLH